MHDHVPNRVGNIIDERYRLDKLLGHGGMGTIYLGYHVKLLRRVAVKIMHLSSIVRSDDVLRFHREARAAAAIGHKGIVEVFDVGTTQWGDPYLVMEYLEGESLETLLQSQAPFDLQAAVEITEQLLLALAAAHKKGIIHRDIKPDNIFLVHERSGSKPTVKLIDFGVSKIMSRPDSGKLTQTGTFIGTPAYAAPEQANCDNAIDHRADLYSVGVVFYEMLTGELPYIGETFNDLVLKIVSQAPRPPHKVNPNFPQEAGPFLERALSKKPKDRFQNAKEMLAALAALKNAEASEQSCVELNALIGHKSCATGDLGSEPPAGIISEPGIQSDQAALDALADQSAYQLEENSWIKKGTMGTHTRLLLFAGASVLIFLFALLLLKAPEPAAPPSATHPVTQEGISPTSSEPTASTKDASQTPQTNKLDEPSVGADSSHQDSADSALTANDISAGKEGVEPQKTKHNKVSAPARKAKKKKKSATAKPVDQAKQSDKSRFLKGGRQTEIAQDFE